MTTRPATPTEIAEAHRLSIKYGWKVTFRHFVREIDNPRARNGVSHRRFSRAKLQMVDGRLCVRHHGKLQWVTATWQDTDLAGKPYPHGPVVFDLRIDSAYLPE